MKNENEKDINVSKKNENVCSETKKKESTKKLYIYAVALLVSALVLILISAMAQNRVTKEQTQKITADLTTQITNDVTSKLVEPYKKQKIADNKKIDEISKILEKANADNKAIDKLLKESQAREKEMNSSEVVMADTINKLYEIVSLMDQDKKVDAQKLLDTIDLKNLKAINKNISANDLIVAATATPEDTKN